MGFLLPILTTIGSFFAANAPAITAGSALAGAGASIGSTISNSLSSGGTPSVSTPPNVGPLLSQPVTTPSPGPQPQQVYSANANEQASTGGSFGLSPQAQSALVDLLSSGGSAGGVNFGGASA